MCKCHIDKKIWEKIRNPAMCLEMAKRLLEMGISSLSDSMKVIIKDKDHLVRIAKTLIVEEETKEKVDYFYCLIYLRAFVLFPRGNRVAIASKT